MARRRRPCIRLDDGRDSADAVIQVLVRDRSVVGLASGRNRGGDRTGVGEALLPGIDAKIHAFERAGSEQYHVTLLAEDHFVDGLDAGRMHQCIPKAPATERRSPRRSGFSNSIVTVKVPISDMMAPHFVDEAQEV